MNILFHPQEQDYAAAAHAAAFGQNLLPTSLNTAFSLPPTTMAQFEHRVQSLAVQADGGGSGGNAGVSNGNTQSAQHSGGNSVSGSGAACLTNGGSGLLGSGAGGGGGGGGGAGVAGGGSGGSHGGFSFTSPTAPTSKDGKLKRFILNTI